MKSDRQDNDLKTIVTIVQNEVAPVMGCTEPLAVAFSAAVARGQLGGEVLTLTVMVDAGLYKNAARVAIPGIERRGLMVASALGVTAGKPEKGLNAISDLTPEEIERAFRLCDSGRVRIQVCPDCRDLFILSSLVTESGYVRVTTRNRHMNVTRIERGCGTGETPPYDDELYDRGGSEIRRFDLPALLSIMKNAPRGTWDFLAEGFDMNMSLADAGLSLGRGIGTVYRDFARGSGTEWNAVVRAKILCASASQARMVGVRKNAMSIAGSGNHGIMAFLGMKAVGDAYGISGEPLYRAMALCILITAYIKTETGTLSAMCGCGVAAGIGLSVGTVMLLGGGEQEMVGAMMNMVGSISGLLCDGAKEGCAFKLSLSAGWAVESALLALRNMIMDPSDGILDADFRKLFRNLGLVCSSGDKAINSQIVNILADSSARSLPDCHSDMELRA